MLSDAELLRDSLRNPEAFVAVFERHYAVIERYLIRRLGHAHGADLASEVFTTAFASRRSFDQRYEDARPWLFGIATNLARRHRRDEERQLAAFARTGIDPLDDSDISVPGGEEVAAALSRLSSDERDVLLLFAWADLSYDAIAAALALPVGTVRSRLNRARALMRQALESAEIGKETVDG